MHAAFRSPRLAVASIVAALLGAATGAAAVELEIEALCNVGRLCRVKVTFGAAEEDIVVTAFHANRVGPDMKYFPAEHYGRTDFPGGGLFHLERQIVLDETDTFVAPQPETDPANVLHWSMTVALDPDGHATFFTGMLHPPGNSPARRAYVWGYPPTTVMNRGSIGGPRSPTAPRKLPPPQRQEREAAVRFTLRCDPANRCQVRALLVPGAKSRRPPPSSPPTCWARTCGTTRPRRRAAPTCSRAAASTAWSWTWWRARGAGCAPPGTTIRRTAWRR